MITILAVFIGFSQSYAKERSARQERQVEEGAREMIKDGEFLFGEAEWGEIRLNLTFTYAKAKKTGNKQKQAKAIEGGISKYAMDIQRASSGSKLATIGEFADYFEDGKPHGGVAQSILPCPRPGSKLMLKVVGLCEGDEGIHGRALLETFDAKGNQTLSPELKITSKTLLTKEMPVTVPNDAVWCRLWVLNHQEPPFRIQSVSLKAVEDDTPAAPTELRVTSKRASDMDIAWKQMGEQEPIGYEVYINDQPRLVIRDGSTTQYRIQRYIEPEKTYTIKLRAIGNYGFSTDSNTIVVTTPGLINRGGGKVYYIDSRSGNDENAGTSEQTAWKSFDLINGTSLQPGDEVLLKRGCTWNQRLILRGSGARDNYICIGAYGTSNLPLPKIDSRGENHESVRIVGGSYWHVKGLEVANDHPYWREAGRTGVRCTPTYYETLTPAEGREAKVLHKAKKKAGNLDDSPPVILSNIVFESLYVHDIQAATHRGAGSSNGGGIFVRADTSLIGGGNFHYENVTVKGCLLERCRLYSIKLGQISNPIVKENLSIGASFCSLLAGGLKGGKIVDNIAYNSGINIGSKDNADIGLYHTDGIVIQGNVIAYTRGGSGEGVNLDTCQNVRILRNYFIGNGSAPFVINETTDTVFCYNIIQDIHHTVLRSMSAPRATFFNNTVYLSVPSTQQKVLPIWTRMIRAGNIKKPKSGIHDVFNNLFITTVPTKLVWYKRYSKVPQDVEGMTFRNNLYFGEVNNAGFESEQVIDGLPKLKAPGKGVFRKELMVDYLKKKPPAMAFVNPEVYTPLAGSEVIDKGVPVAEGQTDFFGQPVGDSPDIGAIEFIRQ